MRVLFVIVLMLSFIVVSGAISFADQGTTQEDIASYRLQMGDKFARGAKNVMFGWTEAPKRIVDLTKETNNPIWGLLAGGFQGTLKAIARTISGVGDMVTAPISPEKPPFVQGDIDVE